MIFHKPCQIVTHICADDTSIFYQHKDLTEIINVLYKEHVNVCEYFVGNKLSI